MSAAERPKAPTGLAAAGRRLWDAVLDQYDLEDTELALLVEAVRTLDALAALDAAVRRDGTIVVGPQGTKAHPGLVEARQQRIALARLLAALRLPLGAEEQAAPGVPQRRGGVRGVYEIKGTA